jgi:7,8-dihydroneopterin aldolase/epimerase/oxygenase
MDAIQITGIRCYGYTGFLPEERILGQWFEVNLTLWLDLSKSGQTDTLDDTCDYRQAISLVKNLITTAKFALVEKLATIIAEDILKLNFIDKVRVQLVKVSPPIPDFGGTIKIDITRTKSDLG